MLKEPLYTCKRYHLTNDSKADLFDIMNSVIETQRDIVGYIGYNWDEQNPSKPDPNLVFTSRSQITPPKMRCKRSHIDSDNNNDNNDSHFMEMSEHFIQGEKY